MLPIFYSFRRCPYAMRARLAVLQAGIDVELREILLKDKPEAFLAVSPSATVPALVTADGTLDESLDIMVWALKQNDPGNWLDMAPEEAAWIERADGAFKSALDRTKYPNRFPDSDPEAALAEASAFLTELDTVIDGWMYGRKSLADYALLPFVRQFAFIDKPWFDAQPWPNLHVWLATFLASDAFAQIMVKVPVWKEGDEALTFPWKDAA